MVKRVLGLALVAVAIVACKTAPGPETGFGTEAPTSARPGGTSDSAFRTIYFDFDSSDLSSDARSGLQENGDYLKSNSSTSVSIEGNCDERGSAEYNLALGKRRAEAARNYLTDLGIDRSRMTTVSFGKERPAVEGHNELAWARNRRDDFRVR